MGRVDLKVGTSWIGTFRDQKDLPPVANGSAGSNSLPAINQQAKPEGRSAVSGMEVVGQKAQLQPRHPVAQTNRASPQPPLTQDDSAALGLLPAIDNRAASQGGPGTPSTRLLPQDDSAARGTLPAIHKPAAPQTKREGSSPVRGMGVKGDPAQLRPRPPAAQTNRAMPRQNRPSVHPRAEPTKQERDARLFGLSEEHAARLPDEKQRKRWEKLNQLRGRVTDEKDGLEAKVTELREKAPKNREKEIDALVTRFEEQQQRTDDPLDALLEMRKLHTQIASMTKLEQSDAHYMQTFIAHQRNWFHLTAAYKAGEVTEDAMEQLWAYRQKVVNERIYNLEKDHGCTCKAFGSTDLTSDIDVNVLTHGTKSGKRDWEIVNAFNEAFQKDFHQVSGIMFDLNFYAAAPLDEIEAGHRNATEDARQKQRDGQHVAGLMKVRRNLRSEEFKALRDQVSEAERGGYDQANRRYVDAQYAILDQLLGRRMDEAPTAHGDWVKTAKDLAERVSQGHEARLAHADDIDDLLTDYQNADGGAASLMDVNNTMYTDGLQQMNRGQQEADKGQEFYEATTNSKGQQYPLRSNQNWERAKQQQAEVQVLRAQAHTEKAQAVFFANEAYQTKGAVDHIVMATQAVKGDLEEGRVEGRSAYDWALANEETQKAWINDETQKRVAKLSASDCLNSLNEQYGDILKDFNHYAGQPPGYVFTRASKYMGRFLLALIALEEKLGGVELKTAPALDHEAATKARRDIEATLLQCRKKGTSTEKVSNKERVAIMKDALGVETIDGAKGLFKRIFLAANARAAEFATNQTAARGGGFKGARAQKR